MGPVQIISLSAPYASCISRVIGTLLIASRGQTIDSMGHTARRSVKASFGAREVGSSGFGV